MHLNKLHKRHIVGYWYKKLIIVGKKIILGWLLLVLSSIINFYEGIYVNVGEYTRGMCSDRRAI